MEDIATVLFFGTSVVSFLSALAVLVRPGGLPRLRLTGLTSALDTELLAVVVVMVMGIMEEETGMLGFISAIV